MAAFRMKSNWNSTRLVSWRSCGACGRVYDSFVNGGGIKLWWNLTRKPLSIYFPTHWGMMTMKILSSRTVIFFPPLSILLSMSIFFVNGMLPCADFLANLGQSFHWGTMFLEDLRREFSGSDSDKQGIGVRRIC